MGNDLKGNSTVCATLRIITQYTLLCHKNRRVQYFKKSKTENKKEWKAREHFSLKHC